MYNCTLYTYSTVLVQFWQSSTNSIVRYETLISNASVLVALPYWYILILLDPLPVHSVQQLYRQTVSKGPYEPHFFLFAYIFYLFTVSAGPCPLTLLPVQQQLQTRLKTCLCPDPLLLTHQAGDDRYGLVIHIRVKSRHVYVQIPSFSLTRQGDDTIS